MLQYIFGIVLLTAVTILYTCFIKPRKDIDNYRRKLEAKGFRVHVWPYVPFKLSTIKLLLESARQGDALKPYKQVFPHYDVAIGNYFNKPLIQFLSPQFREEFGKAERDQYYRKLPEMTAVVKRALGNGLGMS